MGGDDTAVTTLVPRLWPGSTVVCLGGGPSLTAEDVDYCRGRARVIAINDQHRLAPWADVLYAGDRKWWDHYEGVPGFGGLKYAMQRGSDKWPGVMCLRNTGPSGIERDPTGLRLGRNSGYAAINLAIHFGAAVVVLLGYDMQARDPKHTHWFGNHPKPLCAGDPNYPASVELFGTMVEPLKALGVQVINCTRDSAIWAFPCKPLREVLSA